MTEFKEFLKGAVSGMFGVLISHPFDTIKTSIQDNKKIVYNFNSLYRGVLPALSGVGLEKAFVFGTYMNTKKYLSTEIENNYLVTSLSGGISGLTASLIVTPVERLKILAQTGNKITKTDLCPKKLYRGISATTTREIPGFAIYFTTYEYLKNTYYGNNIPLHMSFLFGALSGGLSWCGIYPQDVVKTRMQASTEKVRFREMVSKLYNEGGVKIFFKGFHFALIRAVPLHAGTFMMMEFLNR
jgi:solute carrier family 25 carnitine/acylcarnitine transporter 20/29